MSDKLRVYSPKAVSVTYGGKLPIKHFADGTSIEIARTTPNTTVTAGMQGDQGIVKSADKSGTITFTIKQTSSTNIFLSSLQAANDESEDIIREGITISDPSGGVLVSAKDCHLQEPSSMALGDTENSRVWMFFCEELNYLNVPKGVIETAALASRTADILSSLRSSSDANNLEIL